MNRGYVWSVFCPGKAAFASSLAEVGSLPLGIFQKSNQTKDHKDVIPSGLFCDVLVTWSGDTKTREGKDCRTQL